MQGKAHSSESSVIFDFVNFVSCLDIAIDVVEPRVTLLEGGELDIKVVNVMLCTTECAFSALKKTSHGDKTRSDEKPRILKGSAPLPKRATEAA
jgi:hypothetical protein